MFYTVAFIIAQKKKLRPSLLLFQSAGLILDLAATSLMILGSKNSPFTIHGMFGYSALAAMLIETFLLWRLRFTAGAGGMFGRTLHLYTRFAYIWWVLAFVLGGVLVLFKY
jgi:hypothetical protein